MSKHALDGTLLRYMVLLLFRPHDAAHSHTNFSPAISSITLLSNSATSTTTTSEPVFSRTSRRIGARCARRLRYCNPATSAAMSGSLSSGRTGAILLDDRISEAIIEDVAEYQTGRWPKAHYLGFKESLTPWQASLPWDLTEEWCRPNLERATQLALKTAFWYLDLPDRPKVRMEDVERMEAEAAARRKDGKQDENLKSDGRCSPWYREVYDVWRSTVTDEEVFDARFECA
jgi:hypothetical protein